MTLATGFPCGTGRFADEAVHPGVHDGDFELRFFLFRQRRSHPVSERRFPEGSEIFSVHFDMCHVADLAEVEDHTAVSGEHRIGGGEFLFVGSVAREVFDSRAVRPRSRISVHQTWHVPAHRGFVQKRLPTGP